ATVGHDDRGIELYVDGVRGDGRPELASDVGMGVRCFAAGRRIELFAAIRIRVPSTHDRVAPAAATAVEDGASAGAAAPAPLLRTPRTPAVGGGGGAS